MCQGCHERLFRRYTTQELRQEIKWRPTSSQNSAHCVRSFVDVTPGRECTFSTGRRNLLCLSIFKLLDCMIFAASKMPAQERLQYSRQPVNTDLFPFFMLFFPCTFNYTGKQRNWMRPCQDYSWCSVSSGNTGSWTEHDFCFPDLTLASVPPKHSSRRAQ